MSWMDEFKTFAMKGNMVDLAIGVVIGAAFGKLVNSLVNDVIMPPIGILIGGVDFSDLSFTLKEAHGDKPAVTLQYGAFINTLIDFFIIALTIFVVIKVMNKIRRVEPEKPVAPSTKECPECCMNVPLKAKRCAYCNTIFN